MFSRKLTYRQRSAIAVMFLFMLAVGVRLLTWQDHRLEFPQIEWAVTAQYKEGAQLILQGQAATYLHSVPHIFHPPGYPLIIAVIFKTLDQSDTALQMFQIICDAFAVVVLFLIVSALTSTGTGVVAGLIVALSPQLAYYPSLLLPDSMSVLPILLAIYCLVLAYRRPRILTLVLAGAFVGASCWLRSNALLLPFFLLITIPILFQRGRRTLYAAVLVLGAMMVIAPITIKNLIVFHKFVPLSLGAGHTLLLGISGYDRDQRFDIPRSDMGIVEQEAVLYNRPDYRVGGLFSVDGIERDRRRLLRGWSVIRAHPLWYLGVMGKRAWSFPHLARRLEVSAQPTNSHPLDFASEGKPKWSFSPETLLKGATASAQSRILLTEGGQSLLIISDDSTDGKQMETAPLAVRPGTDYVMTVPINLHEGVLRAIVVDGQQQPLYSAEIYPPESSGLPEREQRIALPFASGSTSSVRLVLTKAQATPRAQIGTIELFESGSTSYTWTRLPRLLINLLQVRFVDLWAVLFTWAGVALLALARKWQALTLLLIVPLYYVCFQSALHTEMRYLIVLHYFFFALAGVGISLLIKKLRTVPGLILRKSQT